MLPDNYGGPEVQITVFSEMSFCKMFSCLKCCDFYNVVFSKMLLITNHYQDSYSFFPVTI